MCKSLMGGTLALKRAIGFKVSNSIDHVNFVYNKCYLAHSLDFLAGKILLWS